MYAVAPLASTVTHSAAGDVGVDLFLVAALWCMAGYAAQGATAWMAAAAVACGMAFAAKYQGALGLWLVGLPPLLLCIRKEISFRTFFLQGCAAVAGMVVGILALTPAFLINTRRTWRDIRGNFAFIRTYGVSSEFLERPVWERIGFGLGRNLPQVVSALGWALTLAALLCAVWVGVTWLRRMGAARVEANGNDVPHAPRLHATILAAVAFPLVALLLSTAFKPMVQPYHFSYLVPFLALAAAALLEQGRGRWERAHGAAAWLLILLAMIEGITGSLREDFFWRRGETFADARAFSQEVFRKPKGLTHRYRHAEAMKHFFAEPSRLPVFRNRAAGIHRPDAEAWRRQQVVPVPSVPLPGTSEWIFLNGPVFPRNDRMFRVDATASRRDASRRTLVFEEPPEEVHVGLRTGRLPARYTIRCSGKRLHGVLHPHSQVVLAVDGLRSVHASREGERRAYPVPLRVHASLGPVWVTVLQTEPERALYQAHGPEPVDRGYPAGIPYLDAAELEERLAALRYLDSDGVPRRLIPGQPLRLPEGGVPLGAGAYRFEATLLHDGASDQTLRLEWIDRSGFPVRMAPFEDIFTPGLHRISWTFEKAFAPYDALLLVQANAGGTRILDWHIRPDAAGLAAWRSRPVPCPDPPITEVSGWRPGQVVYPGLGRWRGMVLPADMRPGESIRYAVRFDLDPGIGHTVLREAVVFLHVKSPDGRQVKALDYSLRKAALTDDGVAWQTAVWPEDLPPGSYSLKAGIYNGRTRQRFPFLPCPSLDMDSRRHVFRVGEITAAP